MHLLKYLLISMLFVQTNAFSQQTKLIPIRINWHEYKQNRLYSEQLENDTNLFFGRTPLDEPIVKAKITIKEDKYVVATPEELNYINKAVLSTSIKINSKIVLERKKQVLNYSFLPYRLNPISGIIERLTECALEISPDIAPQKKENSRVYAENSLLASGNWFKIKIDTTGIFKITFDELQQIGLSNPANVRLYGYGGLQLPYMNSVENYDDLIELPIAMDKGADNVFNQGDYILFYSLGPVTWKYDESRQMFMHKLHNYSSFTYLFITSDFGAGLNVETENQPAENPTLTSNSFDSYRCHEIETYNLIESGRTWYGEKFRQGSSINFLFSFPDIITSEKVKMLTNIVGRKETTAPACYFNINVNNEFLTKINITDSYSEYTYGKEYSRQLDLNVQSSGIQLSYSFGGGNSSSEGYLNYICLNAREKINYNKKQLQFRDNRTLQANQITEFAIENNGNDVIIWDVTTPILPIKIPVTTNGSVSKIKVATSTLREFVVFNPSNAFKPIMAGDDLGLVTNQNLHGIGVYEMIIVTHPDFITHAEELAEIHRTMDGLSIYITTPDKIYNEFSSGTPDVAAIRNFLRMLYDRAETDAELPKYLLLFGDGSYDNRTIGKGNSNLLPTYQSINALSETASYVSDDFFGLLDWDEGEYIGALDLGIGRFPVQTKEEAQLMIDKVKQYSSGEMASVDWKSTICFIGDDGDGAIHMSQPDFISKSIVNYHPEFNIKKIYLDAYEQISTPSGQRFPDVTKAINEQVAQGALIIDYVGHGNPRILAHEEVLTSSDVRSWTNFDRLSVFVTASCEVGRFDDFNRTSLGEWFLLNPTGGGIATLTTTRVVYSGGNHNLNTNFFNVVFDTDLRLGDIIRIAKVNTTGLTNKRNFTLLGDPALKLSIPKNRANIFEINGNSLPPVSLNQHNPDLSIAFKSQLTAFAATDTLNALAKANVTGYIQDLNENKISQNGTLFISVFDKTDTVFTLGQDNSVLKFQMQDKILYKGKASITNGHFSFDFIVPKDINYKFGNGKIHLFAQLDSTEAVGYSTDLIIGGNAKNAELDLSGPSINLYMNDTLFINGGTTNEKPLLLAVLTDESGINTTGNGFGHNIIAVLDGDQDNVLVLNNFYQGAMDKYNSGEVKYQLANLAPGYHSIYFKAWDIYNNSAESSITFYVHHGENLVLEKLQNAPNPFYEYTHFTFEHNQAGVSLDITIDIFDMMGTKVAAIHKKNVVGGYKTEPISWNGTSLAGAKLSKGIYIYRASIVTIDGQKTTKSSKLMIFE